MWNHLSKSHSWLEAEQEAGLLASWHAAAHTNHFQGFRKTSPWKYHLLKDMGAAQDGSKGLGGGERRERIREEECGNQQLLSTYYGPDTLYSGSCRHLICLCRLSRRMVS